MNIVIEGLNLKVGRRMMTDTANKIFIKESNSHDGLVDVTINPNVIMRVYDDVIIFLSGDKLTGLQRSEFFNITIQ